MRNRDLIRVDPLFLSLTWREDRLESISLEWSESSAAGRKSALITPWAEPFRDSLARYLSKKDPAWPEIPLAGDGLSDFAWKVLRRLRTLPTGAWLSYGELATDCGHPMAARAVGRVMARNPWPLLFPCHRVLGRSGQLTGFGPGLEMKQYLLAHEGIPHAPVNRGAL
ncbi:methylated-DNA--[protein]-cysteine S-methyltransferase [Desulfonatronum thiodismutans]|uniref:methylated-DNA--[protein]-cysteine S-methyltransferase n=1 Tax=Desulfonatronum thiodismutans TaxID=159290 RepID=UPI0004ABE0F7|nr:MGMT family protein [Desulfonatronum thiodismutans]